jgi:two-component system sensor histidine kinase YesM
LNLDKKIQVFLGVVICLVAIVCLSVSGLLFTRSSQQRSQALAQEEIAALAGSFASSLRSYKSTAWTVMMDASIKAFLHQEDLPPEKKADAAGNAKAALSSILNQQSSINFIAVIPEGAGGEDFIYRSSALVATGFMNAYEEDCENSIRPGKGTIRFSYSDAYDKGGTPYFNLYAPLYDTSKLGQTLGLVCISINDAVLNQIRSRNDRLLSSNVTLVAGDKQPVVSSGKDPTFDSGLELSGDSGSYQAFHTLYVFKKVDGWNYYMVMSLPRTSLYRDSYAIILISAGITAALAALTFFLSRKIVRRFYKPLDDIVQKMDSVSTGEIKTRIAENLWGEDFSKLASGFNIMMQRIECLMAQVVQEQYEMDQIKFNALQSQIQPHFLYNTLECIRWQAKADKDSDTSVLIKAFANYYRICLSGGKDIIDLSQEIEHIRNYLTIQNIRFDNVIDCEIDIPEKYFSVLIPKMTLQPLIENSICHGIIKKEGNRGAIAIKAFDAEGVLSIVVSDDGVGLSRADLNKLNESLKCHENIPGYGVANVNRRIELIYGPSFGLHFEAAEAGGLEAWIAIPLDSGIKYKGVL